MLEVVAVFTMAIVAYIFGGGKFRAHGGRSLGRSSSLVCQLCNKPVHTSFNCHHRFDQNFQPSPPLLPPYAHFIATCATRLEPMPSPFCSHMPMQHSHPFACV